MKPSATEIEMPIVSTIDAEAENQTARRVLRALMEAADAEPTVVGFVLVLQTEAGCVTVGGNHIVGAGNNMSRLREELGKAVTEMSRQQTGLTRPIAQGTIGDNEGK